MEKELRQDKIVSLIEIEVLFFNVHLLKIEIIKKK